MFKVFRRTAKTAEQFSSARKYHIAYVMSSIEAINLCNELNSKRSARQVKNGTFFEWTKV